MTSTPEERLARLEKRVHELEAERQELAEGMADGLVKLIYARILLAVGERASSCLSHALSGYPASHRCNRDVEEPRSHERMVQFSAAADISRHDLEQIGDRRAAG